MANTSPPPLVIAISVSTTMTHLHNHNWDDLDAATAVELENNNIAEEEKEDETQHTLMSRLHYAVECARHLIDAHQKTRVATTVSLLLFADTVQDCVQETIGKDEQSDDIAKRLAHVSCIGRVVGPPCRLDCLLPHLIGRPNLVVFTDTVNGPDGAPLSSVASACLSTRFVFLQRQCDQTHYHRRLKLMLDSLRCTGRECYDYESGLFPLPASLCGQLVCDVPLPRPPRTYTTFTSPLGSIQLQFVNVDKVSSPSAPWQCVELAGFVDSYQPHTGERWLLIPPESPSADESALLSLLSGGLLETQTAALCLLHNETAEEETVYGTLCLCGEAASPRMLLCVMARQNASALPHIQHATLKAMASGSPKPQLDRPPCLLHTGELSSMIARIRRLYLKKDDGSREGSNTQMIDQEMTQLRAYFSSSGLDMRPVYTHLVDTLKLDGAGQLCVSPSDVAHRAVLKRHLREMHEHRH